MASGLSRRDAKGSAITLGTKATATLISLGGTAVFARLLTPGDFGLVDMLGTGLALMGTFGNFGLSQATVQKYDLKRGEVNNLFWLNCLFGLTLWGVCSLLAPLIALFYGVPELTAVARVGSFVFVWSALKAQPEALLQRRRHFLELGAAQIGGQAIGLAAGIWVATHGGAYWALITNSITSTFATALLGLWFARFLPGGWDRTADIRPMLKFGANLVLSALIAFSSRNLDRIVIGKVWGEAPLGEYTRAYRLYTLPLQLASGPLATVMLPSLARRQLSPGRLGVIWFRSVAFLIMTGSAISLILSLEAKGFVGLVLGSQWTAIIPYVQVLCGFGVIQPILNSSGWVFISSGNTKYMVITGLINTAVIAAAFLLFVKLGVLKLIWAYSLAQLLVALPVNVGYILKVTGLGPRAILRLWGPAFGLIALWGAAEAGFHWLLAQFTSLEETPVFFLSLAFATATWFILAWWGPFEVIQGFNGRRKAT